MTHDLKEQVIDDFGKQNTPEILTSLSEMIRMFNEGFGTDVPTSEADRITIDQWLKNLENDPELNNIAQESKSKDFRHIYERKFEEQILDSFSDNQPLVSKALSDIEFKRKISVAAGAFYKKHSLNLNKSSTRRSNR